jgi:hypothetical protein
MHSNGVSMPNAFPAPPGSGGVSLRHRKVFAELVDDDEPITERPLFRAMKSADMFPKPKAAFRSEQTLTGAAFSVFVAAVMVCLVLWEVLGYGLGWDAYSTDLTVDAGITSGVPINFDITFPSLPCHEVNVDLMDVSDDQQDNVEHDFLKVPVDAKGLPVYTGFYKYKERHFEPVGAPIHTSESRDDPQSPDYCGPCYLEEHQELARYKAKTAASPNCCNTCDAVFTAYDALKMNRPHHNEVLQCVREMSMQNPGCRLKGYLVTKKVKGNFHFLPGRAIKRMPGFQRGAHMHQFTPQQILKHNVSHIIHSFTVGDERIERFSKRGVVQPLEGIRYASPTDTGTLAFRRYFLKLVPTAYLRGNEAKHRNDAEAPMPVQSFEYSAQYQTKEFKFHPFMLQQIPGLIFVFDFYPIQINTIFQRKPLKQLLVRLCGIVGGFFVIMGFVDRGLTTIARRGRQEDATAAEKWLSQLV